MKPKYYYMGKRIYTTGELIKRFFIKVFEWFVAIVLFGFVVFGLLKTGSSVFKQTVYQTETKEVLIDNLSVKINELKGALVNDLKQCESQGMTEDIGLITFDGNKNNKKVEIASIGSYQFKKATIIYYYDLIYNKDITGKEAILIALDDEKAGQLASDIIFKTDKGITNWYNCAKKINASSRLATINELLK